MILIMQKGNHMNEIFIFKGHEVRYEVNKEGAA